MNVGITALAALVLFSGCQKEDTETKMQLAQLQAQLDAEKAEKARREEQERQQKQQQEQEAREEQIRQETAESVRAQLQMEAEMEAQIKAAEAKEKQQQQAKQQKVAAVPKVSEKVVRYSATVVTQTGYGSLSLRGEASTQGLEIGKVHDGEEVLVIAKTNLCQVIGNVEGCWVKVDAHGVKGYMFDGYLNREVLSQEEKARLLNQQNYGEESSHY